MSSWAVPSTLAQQQQEDTFHVERVMNALLLPVDQQLRKEMLMNKG
jgi:hypothetical protein